MCAHVYTQIAHIYTQIYVYICAHMCILDQLDYIEMRDGDSEDSPLMGRFCGDRSKVPSSMQTTQNHLRLR